MKGFTPHKQWLVTNYTSRKYSPKFSCCPNDTFPTLIADFHLQRHSPMMHAVYITPAIGKTELFIHYFWRHFCCLHSCFRYIVMNLKCHCSFDGHYIDCALVGFKIHRKDFTRFHQLRLPHIVHLRSSLDVTVERRHISKYT